jgi:hypothetical protein
MSRIRLLMVLAVGAGMLGCDSGGDDSSDLFGTWETQGADVQFSVISQSQIVSYDYLGDIFDDGPDCYVVDTTLIQDLSDSSITITDPEIGAVTLAYELDGDVLRVIAFDETITMFRSSRTVSSFTPVCVGQPKTTE